MKTTLSLSLVNGVMLKPSLLVPGLMLPSLTQMRLSGLTGPKTLTFTGPKVKLITQEFSVMMTLSLDLIAKLINQELSPLSLLATGNVRPILLVRLPRKLLTEPQIKSLMQPRALPTKSMKLSKTVTEPQLLSESSEESVPSVLLSTAAAKRMLEKWAQSTQKVVKSKSREAFSLPRKELEHTKSQITLFKILFNNLLITKS